MRAAPDPSSSRAARTLELGLALYASVVFALMWVCVASAIATDGRLLSETWAWLAGLPLMTAVVAWLLLLPVAIFVWAWQANLEPVWMAIIVTGLAMWSGLAWGGLLRTLLRRRRPRG